MKMFRALGRVLDLKPTQTQAAETVRYVRIRHDTGIGATVKLKDGQICEISLADVRVTLDEIVKSNGEITLGYVRSEAFEVRYGNQ